jgi:2-polyprenyl-6-methoxyphenol hydroxylase-like FAD-dependent oxidoreductase
LELLDSLDLASPLVRLGNPSARLVWHLGARRAAEVQLGAVGNVDTRFPFILFVSQAETERLLAEHLSRSGVTIERRVELVDFTARGDGVDCSIRDPEGRPETIRARYIVGCDGAHSAVRKGSGFTFEGGSYPQDFVLGDVEADGSLEPDAINSFVGGGGVAMFFPLRHPTTWRVIAMKAETPRVTNANDAGSLTSSLSLADLQSIIDAPTERSVRVRDPAWLTRFHLHHRQTARYRAGRVFLAGDAAHIHSPVGAQGMNTGIQDAWNLGWKLGLVARGAGHDALLDTYESERWAVGRFLLRYTDRIFVIFTRAMSAGRVATWAREIVVPRVVPRVAGTGWLRAAAFRFVSELGIHYRRSAAVTEGTPRLRKGPRAGNRLPDARLTIDGQEIWLQRAVVGPYLALVLCGDEFRVSDSKRGELAQLASRFDGLLTIHHLSRRPSPGVLHDEDGKVLQHLGVTDAAQYLIRPDGYIAFRCEGNDLKAVTSYLDKWLLPAHAAAD